MTSLVTPTHTMRRNSLKARGRPACTSLELCSTAALHDSLTATSKNAAGPQLRMVMITLHTPFPLTSSQLAQQLLISQERSQSTVAALIGYALANMRILLTVSDRPAGCVDLCCGAAQQRRTTWWHNTVSCAIRVYLRDGLQEFAHLPSSACAAARSSWVDVAELSGLLHA